MKKKIPFLLVGGGRGIKAQNKGQPHEQTASNFDKPQTNEVISPF